MGQAPNNYPAFFIMQLDSDFLKTCQSFQSSKTQKCFTSCVVFCYDGWIDLDKCSFKLATNMKQNINCQICTQEPISKELKVCRAPMAAPLGPVSAVLFCSLVSAFEEYLRSIACLVLRPIPSEKTAWDELCWQRRARLSLDEWEPLVWHDRNVRQHLSERCQQHSDSTLCLSLLWWTSFHHISFFIWLLHRLSYGCFPHCSLVLVNTKSVFLCLSARQRFSQPSAILRQRKTQKKRGAASMSLLWQTITGTVKIF